MIRHAQAEDMDTILGIYTVARRYMADHGNKTQWAGSYPDRQTLTRDIQNRQLFVCVEGGAIHGVFAFIIGPDATYARIENGAWKNDAPYGTIHRVASDGKTRGIFQECLEFCRRQISNLRIDTHHDNRTMRHLIEKNGFETCGIICTGDGTPRIAYQYTGA